MTSKDGVAALTRGMKVVCISNGSGTLPGADSGVHYPLSRWGIVNAVKGEIYTIRDLIETGDGYGVLLVEIDNSHVTNSAGREPTFWAHRFRPLVTKTQEQDLEAFTPLLSIGNEELAADKQRVDYLLDALELAWAAHGVEE